MPERRTIIRVILYAAYFLAAFLVFLLLLFPFDRVKTKIEAEVRSRTPLELTIARISPRFFNRFVLSDVVLADRSGTVLFESPTVYTTLPFLSLLRGMPAVSLQGRAYGGELSVKVRQEAGNNAISADLNNLDVAAYPLLKATGLKIAGKLGGTFELSGDAGRARLWLKSVTTRELRIKGFPVPDLDFEQCWIEADIKGDRLTIKKLELNGKELTFKASGDLVMQARGTLNLVLKFKPSERLIHEQAGILSLLKVRDAEGYYQFTLGGTLSEPLPRL